MESKSPPIRVAIVEDRHQEREHLAALLDASPGFACVAACANADEAVSTLPSTQPDIVLMDIRMPGMSGVDCVIKLKPLLPNAQVMMWTAVEDHDLIFKSLAAGANGYVLKKTAPTRLLESIAELHAGGAPMSGQIARKVVACFHAPAAGTPAPSHKDGMDQLSPVQQSVLELLARGYLYKEVADSLGMSIGTVRTHVWHIYRKLQVHNRTEAILKYKL